MWNFSKRLNFMLWKVFYVALNIKQFRYLKHYRTIFIAFLLLARMCAILMKMRGTNIFHYFFYPMFSLWWKISLSHGKIFSLQLEKYYSSLEWKGKRGCQVKFSSLEEFIHQRENRKIDENVRSFFFSFIFHEREHTLIRHDR